MHKQLIAVAVIVMAGTAWAQGTPRMERREARQAARIEQGVASGEITAREARRLAAGDRRIDRMESRAARDGRFTAAERARIDGAQDARSRRIHRNRLDGQRDLDGDGRADRPRGG